MDDKTYIAVFSFINGINLAGAAWNLFFGSAFWGFFILACAIVGMLGVVGRVVRHTNEAT